MDTIWQFDSRLAESARLRRGAPSMAGGAAWDLAILLALGILAAFASTIPTGFIRMPGHAILRGTFPMILGISLVPRRSSGTAMSAVAAGTLAAMRLAGYGTGGAGAVTALLCLGPALDLALLRPHEGRELYLRTGLAGLTANLIAFAVRMGMSLLGTDTAGSHGVLNFWPLALASFAAFGALAGFLGGAVWFRATPRDRV